MITTLKTAVQNILSESGEPLFKEVGSAFGVQQAMSSPLQASPVAFVVPIAEDPSPNSRDVGLTLQEMKQTYGVLIGLITSGDDDSDIAELERVRQLVRDELYGQSLLDGFEPFSLANNNMQSLQNGQLFWMDRFVTEQTVEAR